MPNSPFVAEYRPHLALRASLPRSESAGVHVDPGFLANILAIMKDGVFQKPFRGRKMQEAAIAAE